MSIDLKKHNFSLATLFYWCAIVILATLLCLFSNISPRFASGIGRGFGDGGDGTGAGSGQGSSLTGTGSGDRSLDANGTASAAVEQRKEATTHDTPVASGNASANATAENEKLPDVPEESPEEIAIRQARPFEFHSSTAVPTASSASSRVAAGRPKGFFGVDIVKSGRVIFLIDISGSMNSISPEGGTRLEALKRELTKVITEMSRKASAGANSNQKQSIMTDLSGKFRIACFSGCMDLHPQEKEKIWSFGKKSDVESALQFVSSLSAGGGTNMMGAWQGLESVIVADRITAVYFLSDGEDGCGNALLAYLKQKYPGLVIHTFAMGLHSQLMEDIARQHRGKYIEIF